MMKNNRTRIVLGLAGVAMVAIALAAGTASAEPILMVDFGSAGVEPGFVGQTTYSDTHSTVDGNVTVDVAGSPQGFYVFAGGGTNPALFDDFIFDNSGPFTMALSGPGISASTDYDLTFWAYYAVQARNTTITAVSGTTGTTLGPIAFVNPTTSLSDNAASGIFTSDPNGNLTFSLGAGRPALNAFTITAVSTLGDADGDGDVDAADYIALKTHMGTASGAVLADGDFHPNGGDGDVDWDDLQVLIGSYGATGNAAGPLPEPATLALLAMGGLAVIRRRRGYVGQVRRRRA